MFSNFNLFFSSFRAIAFKFSTLNLSLSSVRSLRKVLIKVISTYKMNFAAVCIIDTCGASSVLTVSADEVDGKMDASGSGYVLLFFTLFC